MFRSLYAQGFARVAACTVPVTLADPTRNAQSILATAQQCHDQGVAVAIFPELGLSGYALDDLLMQDALLNAVLTALETLRQASETLLPLLLVGAPLHNGTRLYNCAIAIHRGRILGIVPKTYLPNYREFYEHRQFAAGATAPPGTLTLSGEQIPFGPLLFEAEDVPNLIIHPEICEDVWVPIPPSSAAALAGATILANLSASNIVIGKAETRRLLAAAQSARCLAAYLYAAAGTGESTTDLAWDGQVSIHELGATLAETPRFATGAATAIADIDLDLLRQERLRQGSFDDNRAANPHPFRRILFRLNPPQTDLGLRRPVERFPFAPSNPARRDQDCYEAYNIQVAALAQRLTATGITRVVIGVSGGLDSTQALIVAARALDRLNLPRANLLAYTMPGFATGTESRTLAHALMSALGATPHELPITETATLMLQTLNHPAGQGTPLHDITYENVQAGLRTDYLFRLANQHNALVLGTGDLSELALGWCTYGVGDQMSHYNVNAGVPKTLIQHLIAWVAGTFPPEVAKILHQILAAEISPELIPGATPQSTEATIGPYALHDFTLYWVLRHGLRPRRILYLAERAFAEGTPHYPLPVIAKWMELFLTRFFATQQFKRSAMPNGPKVAAGGSLSPRGDWRAPSDASAAVWLQDLKAATEEAQVRGFAPEPPLGPAAPDPPS